MGHTTRRAGKVKDGDTVRLKDRAHCLLQTQLEVRRRVPGLARWGRCWGSPWWLREVVDIGGAAVLWRGTKEGF